MDKVTIATSTGALWLAITSHFGMGLIALVSGTIAIAVAKGGKLHKKSGLIFTIAMMGLGLTAAGIYIATGRDFSGGVFVVYLVFTAMTTVKHVPGSGRTLDIALMIVAFACAAAMYRSGMKIWALPGHQFRGVPAPMVFFIGTIALLAGLGDFRMIREGGFRGPKRIARHLWRMCFALFVGTGSFFLGQMKFLPKQLQIMPLMMVLALAPLPILLYWMWRVRLRKRLAGITIA